MDEDEEDKLIQVFIIYKADESEGGREGGKVEEELEEEEDGALSVIHTSRRFSTMVRVRL